jgi:hypothetical protein
MTLPYESTKAKLAHITTRLNLLHELVLRLLEVHPLPQLVKAEAMIDTAITLRRINFDVMLNICQALEEYKKLAPGGMWQLAANAIIEADDVLFDLPIPLVTTAEAHDVN